MSKIHTLHDLGQSDPTLMQIRRPRANAPKAGQKVTKKCHETPLESTKHKITGKSSSIYLLRG